MAWDVGGSIRVAGVADAAAIAAVHVGAWRETYVGIVPVQVLAGLSVDRRTETPMVNAAAAILSDVPKWARIRRRLLRNCFN